MHSLCIFRSYESVLLSLAISSHSKVSVKNCTGCCDLRVRCPSLPTACLTTFNKLFLSFSSDLRWAVNFVTSSFLLPYVVSWNSTYEVPKTRRTNWGKASIANCCGSAKSPRQPEATTEISLWFSLLPRPLVYSSNFSDVDAVQLSELWWETLKVRRDPKKILVALGHSYAFVVVLAEDEEGQTASRLKIVGVGRAVSDGAFVATICDVAVHPGYRHRGIGRRIVKKLVQDIKTKGGSTGFAVFSPPSTRRFFWMIGFRNDRKYRIMSYKGNDHGSENGNNLDEGGHMHTHCRGSQVS